MVGCMYEAGVLRLLGHATERCGWLTTETVMAALTETQASYLGTAHNGYATNYNYNTHLATPDYEVLEAAPGYTRKGNAITPINPVVVTDGGLQYAKCDASNPAAWTTATFTTGGCSIFDDGVTNDPLLCWLDFGSDKSVTVGTLTVVFDTNGVFRQKIA